MNRRPCHPTGVHRLASIRKVLTRTVLIRTVLIGVALSSATGCAGLHQPEVEQVASTFAAADADPATRCGLLAPATAAALEHDESAACPQAIEQVDLVPGGAVQSSEVWGDNAVVRMTGDTLFLTLTGQGWKVGAAGCTAQGEGPYLCRLEA
jgi:hypothetical protein